MAVTITFYDSYKNLLLSGGGIDMDADTIKVAICSSAYTPNIDTHDYFNDISGEEDGSGYTAGGATLSTTTVTTDTSSDLAYVDSVDIAWTGTTLTNARYGIIYKSTGTDSTSPLIGYIDFDANKSMTDGTFTISWNANGIFKIT